MPETTSKTQTGNTTITTPHGTVSSTTLRYMYYCTTRNNPHRTVSASTFPTGSTTSTTPHGTVSTSTTPTGTTTITTLHGTIYTNHSSNTIMEAIEGSTKSTDKKKDSMMKSQNGIISLFLLFL